MARVAEIYDRIHAEEAAGRISIGWRPGFYPVAQTAEVALRDDELFVMETEHGIVASAIINGKQPAAYSLVKWETDVKPSEVGVIHTLVVDPRFNHAGYGRLFVDFFENYCRQHGLTVARLDTQTINKYGMTFYPKLGYKLIEVKETGFATLPQKVDLAMFEKVL